MEIDQGFPYLMDKTVEPRVLVLGTLPGVRSLEDQQYYAHPQNAFWWIMANLFDFPIELSYREKTARVVQEGVMIWDVIQSCHRPGSLDSSIDQSTLKPNDFVGLFKQYDSLALIVFNGQAARKLFKKHVEKAMNIELSHLTLSVMPSTSPAYAAMRKEQKLEKWRGIKEYLL